MVDLNIFLSEIFAQAQSQKNSYWIKKLLYTNYNRIHLAIMVEPYLSLLLEGKKTIESRFSQKAIIPFRRINTGDLIILKKSGGTIVGIFEALGVHFFELKSESDVLAVKADYNEKLCCSDEFWNSKMNSHFATLVEVGNLMKLTPIGASFKNRQAWIANEVQDCPTILCVSGEIASGKTFIAKKLSNVLDCNQYSVSDFLKMLAVKKGEKNASREFLQALGKEQMDHGWKEFSENFLNFTRWDNTGYLIVDGVRHAEFLKSLSDLIRPWGRLITVFVEANSKVRNERLASRGETLDMAKHVAEGNVLALKENANILVFNNESNSDETVLNAIMQLFNVRIQGAPYGLFR